LLVCYGGCAVSGDVYRAPSNGFSPIKLLAVTAAGAQFGPPGYEVDLLYIACLAALVMGGSGPFAVDRLIGDAFSTYLRHSSVVTPRDDRDGSAAEPRTASHRRIPVKK
jgi:hypothetical protein